MSLSISEVFEQVGQHQMGYVFDAPIHYVVFNRKNNTWTLDRINQYLAILDQIESTTGPGVMVSIGTGKSHFSTGFDLPYWLKDYRFMKSSILRFQELMARLLEFPMPSLCVFNGTAIAGGFIFGLCHDYRIMNEKKGSICLSELKLGLSLTYPYMKVIESKLDPNVCTRMACAITVRSKEAIKIELVEATYSTYQEMQDYLTNFRKKFADYGVQREAIKINKCNQYRQAIDACRGHTFTPFFDQLYQQFHKKLAANQKKGKKQRAIVKQSQSGALPQPKL